MEIVLSEKEVKEILLTWANDKLFGLALNTVDVRASYGSLNGVTLSYEAPDPVIEKVKEALE